MIEVELWWLLALPFFFTLGWLAARIDIKQILAESTMLPAAYFKGLNFLISHQQDKAIIAFSEALEANADSLELHFALGSLFRRSGEIDRAIHLHLNLIENKELTPSQTLAVKAELAQDYLKAGLFDRAEEHFKSLTDSRYQQAALRSLLEIYVREREWERAIETAIELERLSGRPFRVEIAQYHCEIALKVMLNKDYDSAKQSLHAALNANQNCVRANVMLGEIAVAENQHEAAIAYWRHIEIQNPEFISLIASKLLTSYSQVNKAKEGFDLLKDYLNVYQSPMLLNVVFETLINAQSTNEAAELALKQLNKKPSLQTLDQLLETKIKTSTNTSEPYAMQQAVRLAIGKRSAYLCNQCGFRAKHYHWQCPACNAWESLPPEPSEANT